MRRVAAISGIACVLLCRVVLADDTALQQFAALLKQNTHQTAQVSFICQRQMATADAPLVSAGMLYAARKESARYSTQTPYQSDLILSDGKIYARTQHEKEWTKSSLSSKPGLTAVAGFVAGWVVGENRNLNEYFDLAVGSGELPAAPENVKPLNAQSARQFVLLPNNQELKKVVDRIVVIIDASNHELRYVKIFAIGGEMITYWFSPVQSETLPKDIFEAKRDK